MKKIIPVLVLASFLGFLIVPAISSAQTILDQCTVRHDLSSYKGAKGQCPASGQTTDGVCCLLDLMSTIGDWIFAVVLILAVIMLIFGGFQFLLAGGDPGKVASGRQYIIYGVVGVAVAFLAKGIVALVQTILSG
jgi:hypothetical protein